MPVVMEQFRLNSCYRKLPVVVASLFFQQLGWRESEDFAHTSDMADSSQRRIHQPQALDRNWNTRK